MIVSLEPESELVVEDAQIAVFVAHDGLGHDRLNFLRHYADISPVAAVVAEAIETEAIGEVAEKNDVVLERDIGSPSASTAATATASTTTAACPHAGTAACPHAGAGTAASAAETGVTARGLRVGNSSRLNISKGIAAARRPLTRARPSARRPLSCARPLACAGPLPCTRSLSGARLLSSAWAAGATAIAKAGLATARLEHLFAAAAAKIRPALASAA